MKLILTCFLILFPSVLSALTSSEALKLLKKNPADGSLYAELAESYIREENWTEALAAYRKALSYRPEDAGYYVRAAKVCDELRRPDLAFEILNPVRQDFIMNGRFLGSLAATELDLGKFQLALGDYEAALKLSPYKDRPFYLSGIAKCQRELKQYQDSERYFITALQQRDDAWTYYELGKLYLAQKRYADAAHALTQAKARLVGPKKQGREIVCSRLALSIFEHGRELKEKGKKEEAKKAFQKITLDRELSKTAWNEKAQFWLKRL